ncbi:hypothetical protein EJ06DRAFT_529239, partial [Trichodelitschia bisporula]
MFCILALPRYVLQSLPNISDELFTWTPPQFPERFIELCEKFIPQINELLAEGRPVPPSTYASKSTQTDEVTPVRVAPSTYVSWSTQTDDLSRLEPPPELAQKRPLSPPQEEPLPKRHRNDVVSGRLFTGPGGALILGP